MAERLRRVQSESDSVANHVTARSIIEWRALTWLVTETGWTRRKRSAICGGKLIGDHMIPWREQEVQHLEYVGMLNADDDI